MGLCGGMCAGKIIAGVVAIGAASVLGFNWITTGCPTGVCPTERAAQATITPASLATSGKADSCCALMAETEKSACGVAAESCVAEAKSGCCSEGKTEQVAITNVSATLPAAPKGECCADKGMPEPCSDKKECCIENYNLAEKPANP